MEKPIRSIAGAATTATTRDAPRVMVLSYTYVRDDDSLPRPGWPGPFSGIRGITTGEFNKQLDGLCAAYEPIDWPRFYGWLAGHGDLPRRGFLLTFDDGLVDHAETVAPLLEARGLRGVFFVPGTVLAGHRMLSAHAAHLLLAALGDEGFCAELFAYLKRHDLAAHWEKYFEAFQLPADDTQGQGRDGEAPFRERLENFITMELPIPLRTSALDWIFEQHIGSGSRWARHWYLGWADLVRMRGAGHTIGGHGFLHEPYSRMSPADIRRDVMRCGIVLRDGLGADLRPFCYPFGSTSGPAYEACREAGFVHAFTSQTRWITAGADPMQLPRFEFDAAGRAVQRNIAGNAT